MHYNIINEMRSEIRVVKITKAINESDITTCIVFEIKFSLENIKRWFCKYIPTVIIKTIQQL